MNALWFILIVITLILSWVLAMVRRSWQAHHDQWLHQWQASRRQVLMEMDPLYKPVEALIEGKHYNSEYATILARSWDIPLAEPEDNGYLESTLIRFPSGRFAIQTHGQLSGGRPIVPMARLLTNSQAAAGFWLKADQKFCEFSVFTSGVPTV